MRTNESGDPAERRAPRPSARLATGTVRSILPTSSAGVFAMIAALLLALAAIGATPERAQAQTRDVCQLRYEACMASCRARCPFGDAACLRNCPEFNSCQQRLLECRGAGTRGQAPASRAPSQEAPAPAQAPQPRMRSGAPATQSAEEAEPLEARIYFLTAGAREPRARFYGYLVVGGGVDRERRRAVARAVACRLEVAPSLEAAERIDRLGLVTIPATGAAPGEDATPDELIDRYDFDRADIWLRSSGLAAGERFDDRSILFVGSRRARAGELDQGALPPANAQGDPTIADASDLGARYLEAWVVEILEGVRSGKIRDRQTLQDFLEAISWLEWVTDPILNILRVSQAVAAPPAACR